MAVKWLREKCLFLPVWLPWRAPRCRLTLAHPAIFGLGLVLRLGQYGRPPLATAGLLVFYGPWSVVVTEFHDCCCCLVAVHVRFCCNISSIMTTKRRFCDISSKFQSFW